MSCAACGSRLPEHAARCPGCGTPAGEVPVLPELPPPAPPQRRPALEALAATRWGSLLLAVAALGAYLAVQVACGAVLVVVFIAERGAGAGFDPAEFERWIAPWTPAIMLATTAAIVAMVVLLAKLGGLPGHAEVAPTRRTAVVVALAALACIAGQVLISTAQARAGLQATEQEVLTQGLAGSAWLPMALTLVVLAPLSEELLFRRLGYAVLSRPWGRAAAALATTLVFGVIHFNATATFLYVWLALCCTVAYEKTGRTAAPIAVHAVNNSLAVAAMLSQA